MSLRSQKMMFHVQPRRVPKLILKRIPEARLGKWIKGTVRNEGHRRCLPNNNWMNE